MAKTPTDEIIKAVCAFLVNKYGAINDEWYLTIGLLENTLKTKEKVDKQLKKDGIMITDRFGGKIKHPLLKTSQELTVQLIRLIEQLGVSPRAVSRLKTDDNEQEENVKEVLANLLS